MRSLNREIGAVCRKVAKRVVGGDDSKFVVDSDRLRDLMGPDNFKRRQIRRPTKLVLPRA